MIQVRGKTERRERIESRERRERTESRERRERTRAEKPRERRERWICVRDNQEQRREKQ